MYKWLVSLLASCGASTTPTGTTSDCTRACTRYQVCAPTVVNTAQVTTCEKDCTARLTATGQAHYASCMSALTCQAVSDSLTMDEGPAGFCYSSSLP